MAASETVAMIDSAPLIYGLDHECRSMCALNNDQLAVRFLVGTQSLVSSLNQVHLLEYAEESNSLCKVVFKHTQGEIWHLASANKHPQNLITCYSAHGNLNKVENQCCLWNIPIDLSNNLQEECLQSTADLTEVCNFQKFKPNIDEEFGKMARLKPEEENELLLMLETKLLHVDLESERMISIVNSEGLNKNLNRLAKMNTFSWSPHSNGNVVALVCNGNIYSRDLRANSVTAGWNIPQAHCQTVRDLDFNPNSQYYFASCGDDCSVKFWDTRNLSKPVLKMLHHSHWLWAVRYNSLHDQLVLTGSSDGNVNLLRASSIAAQPYGQLAYDELDEEEKSIESLLVSKQAFADSLIVTFKDHEDSVYAVEWSNDPWIFASLSYDGRFIINKVPTSEKNLILA